MFDNKELKGRPGTLRPVNALYFDEYKMWLTYHIELTPYKYSRLRNSQIHEK